MAPRPQSTAAGLADKPEADLFQSMFMDMPLGAALLGPDLAFIASNRELTRLTGYRPDELLGLGLPDIMHPDDCRAKTAPVPCSQGFFTPRTEARLMSKSGRPLWVRLWLQALPGAAEGSEVSVFLAEDVTGQQYMRQARQESRLVLEKAFATLREAVFIVDADSRRILEANPAATAVFGYERSEMIGSRTRFLHLGEGAYERFSKDLLEAVRKQGYLFLPEYPMRHATGRIFPTEHSVMAIEDEHGRSRAWLSVVRDVSEAVEHRRALRESTSLLRAIIDNSNTAIMVRDTEGRHSLVNNLALEMLGMESAVGKTLWDIFPKPVAEHIAEEDRRVVEAGQPMVFEQDSEWTGVRHVLLKAKFPLRDAQGRICAVGSVITNITRLKEAERKLRLAHDELEDQVRERTRELENANRDLTVEIRARRWAEEELLRRDKLLEAASVCSRLLLIRSDFDEAMDESLATLGGAAKVDRVYVYERVSRHYGHQSGFGIRRQWHAPRVSPRRTDLVGSTDKWVRRIESLAQGKTIHGRLRDFFGDDQAALERENVRSIMLVPVLAEDAFWGFIGLEDCHSERIWRDSETTALVAAAGIIGGAIVRRRTEQDLVASESLIRAIVNSAVEGIVTVDESGRISSMNPAAESIFDLEASKALDKPFTNLLAQSWRGLGMHALAAPPGGGNAQEVNGVDGSGRLFPLELAVSSFMIEGRTMFTCLVRDITERKKVEQLKREFLSVVSHELRTPLTSISGAIGLMAAGKAGPIGEQARALLDIASQNSRRLLLLIEDILDIQKIESGRAVFEYDIVDLNDLVREALEETAPMAHAGGISLEEPPRVFEMAVRADPHRLKQVIGNLLSNAFKFSPGETPVRVRVAPGGLGVRVEVRDHGPGVPEHFRERIFERFAQADTTDSRGKGGTGLGLSIAREIIHRHGGRIGYENKPEGGAAFFFELPPAKKVKSR